MSAQERALRVVYMGTPDFAVPALRALAASRHQVVGVVTNPDRPVGRGHKVLGSPVKQAALALGLPIAQPKSLRSPESLEVLSAWRPELIVVAAYGKLLPPSVLGLAPLGCVNIHASLLPRYRGAAPIQWCIARGERVSGVTIMQMEQGLDTGPMLLKGQVSVEDEDTGQSLHDKLAPLGAQLLMEAVEGLIRGELRPEVQDHEAATWAPMLRREDGELDWTRPAPQLHDQIRGFWPWPGAYTTWVDPQGQAQLLKIHRARVVPASEQPDASGQLPGRVVAASAAQDRLWVACGQGTLALELLQAPGRRVMSARDLLNGCAIAPGAQLVQASPQGEAAQAGDQGASR